MLSRCLYGTVVFSLLLPAAAEADGGPSPGVFDDGAGVAAVNGIRYVTLSGGMFTTLESIQTNGGQVLASRNYTGGWGIPFVAFDGQAGGLSWNGKTLVLGQTGFGTCTASGCSLLRSTSRFEIVNPKTLRLHETVTLKGDFSYDALSPGGRMLYLIQHVDTSRYLVRAYDLDRKRLQPGAIADRTQQGWVMQGSPMARALSSNGRFVYTLYQNPGGYPFVHALDSVRGVAHCIGLPLSENQSVLQRLALAPGSGGRTLDVYTAQGRVFFAVDTQTYKVSRPQPRQATTPRHHSFPWWRLAILGIPILAAAALARRRWPAPLRPVLRRRAPA
jgi:hypothetical protein